MGFISMSGKIKFIFILTIQTVMLFKIFSVDKGITLNFLNVGEGESIFIEFNAGQNMLIDSGNFVTSADVVKFLKNKRVEKIDYFISTHPHFDHIGGAFIIPQFFKVENLCDNGESLDGISAENDIYRWYIDFFRNNKKYKKLKNKETLIFGDVEITVLNPFLDNPTDDWNADSLVLKIKYGNFSCLLMGDANSKTEEILVKEDIITKVNILKAGHHGAFDTGSDAFIKKILPETMIISINKNNIRNYPSTEVLAKYKNIGSKILLTFNTKKAIKVNAYKNGKYNIVEE
jgi:competence protein ComEC